MKKNRTLHQLGLISAITSSILIASSVAISVPVILNINNNSNVVNNTNKTKLVQTGNITHEDNIPVVASLTQIDYNSLQIGSSSSAIVNRNGKQEIYVWGLNDQGQLGLGNTTNRNSPTLLDTSVFGEYVNIEVKIGTKNLANDDKPWSSKSSYAIVDRRDGSQHLYMWGQNNFGQLGLGSLNNILSPQEVNKTQLRDFDKIESVYGNEQTIFVVTKKNNMQELYACGQNNNGQLSNGTNTNRNIFQLIPGSSLGNYASIINLYFGDDSFAITVADVNNIWSVYVWGRNDFGQLGLGHTNSVVNATPITNPLFTSDVFKNSKIVVNKSSYLWNKQSNKIYVWGNNDFGQLGNGNTTSSSTIIELVIPGSAGIIKNLQVDYSAFVLIEQNGIDKIYTWGLNTNGQLGLGNTSVTTRPALFNLASIGSPTSIKAYYVRKSVLPAGNTSFALVETANGTQFYGWGLNSYNQLGVAGQQATPIRIPAPNNFKIISATIFDQTKIIVENNGNLEAYVSGRNDFGQLGLGNTTDVLAPVKILDSKESTPSAYLNKTFSNSAADAYNSFYGELTNVFKPELLKNYIDTSTLPPNANLLIDPVNTVINSLEGFIDLTIITDSYYELFNNFAVNNNRSYKFVINGFEKVSDIPIVTKITPNLNTVHFFQNATIGNKVDRAFLEQYINLSCIPQSAILTIEPLNEHSTTEIKFILKSDKVYKNNGVTTNEEYTQTFSFPIEQRIDPILIIGLIAGGSFILLLIFIIIYMSQRRIKKM